MSSDIKRLSLLLNTNNKSSHTAFKKVLSHRSISTIPPSSNRINDYENNKTIRKSSSLIDILNKKNKNNRFDWQVKNKFIFEVQKKIEFNMRLRKPIRSKSVTEFESLFNPNFNLIDTNTSKNLCDFNQNIKNISKIIGHNLSWKETKGIIDAEYKMRDSSMEIKYKPQKRYIDDRKPAGSISNLIKKTPIDYYKINIYTRKRIIGHKLPLKKEGNKSKRHIQSISYIEEERKNENECKKQMVNRYGILNLEEDKLKIKYKKNKSSYDNGIQGRNRNEYTIDNDKYNEKHKEKMNLNFQKKVFFQNSTRMIECLKYKRTNHNKKDKDNTNEKEKEVISYKNKLRKEMLYKMNKETKKEKLFNFHSKKHFGKFNSSSIKLE